jgi:hypothetical protein
VAVCPANPLSFAYSLTSQCIYTCPSPYFGDMDGLQCSLTCPTTPIYYYRDYQSSRCVLSTIFVICRLHLPLLRQHFYSVLR